MSSAVRAERLLFPKRIATAKAPVEVGGVSPRFLFIFGLLHVPFGLVLYNVGSLSLLHPALVALVGMFWAVRSSVPIYKVALVVTYLVGSEVLWRMAQVPVFWEFGKYGSTAIIVTALLVRGIKKVPPLPILYLVALIPSCFLTFNTFGLSEAREHISFNMSGPLSLAAFCVFFANTRMKPGQIKDLFLIGMMPIISIAMSTLFYTISTEDITFTTESNFATSGGFGPNQVSSILGLGVFLAIVVLMLFKETTRRQKILVSILAILFAMQSVMTFSRSGIYNVIGATIVLMFFHFQKLSEGVKRTAPIVVLGLVFFFLVFPKLDDFTGGKLQERFEETGTSNRMDIIGSDLDIFADNPILGVGVGVSKSARREYVGFAAASHTEMSRLISEHGAFGIAAILCILLGVLLTFKQQSSVLGRALVAGLATWALLYMLNAGMRLAAPGYALGLAFIQIVYPRVRRLRPPRFPIRRRPLKQPPVEEIDREQPDEETE